MVPGTLELMVLDVFVDKNVVDERCMVVMISSLTVLA